MSETLNPPETENADMPGTDGGGRSAYLAPLIILTSLFFMWGFITSLNDILIPHLRNAFSLSYTKAMLIQFCFFGAYFVVSIPASFMLNAVGYQRGIVIGLLVAALGCFGFYPAASFLSYPMFLGALFVLAAGVTILQVSANPYVTVLGPPETASSRLTMTQAFNSLGTTVAPYLGAILIFSQIGADDVDQVIAGAAPASDAATVQLPYLGLALAFVVLGVVFHCLRLPWIATDRNSEAGMRPGAYLALLRRYPHLSLGALAIFLYVGAEVAIGSFLINFLGLPAMGGLDESTAANYVAWYWGGAMVGRFLGALVMQVFRPGRVLGFNAGCAALLVVVAILADGPVAMYAIILVGLCNSVMFPTIFSLALAGLGTQRGLGSGVLCLSIVGGAIVPLLQGVLADTGGLQSSFVIPVLCYLYIVFYGLRGSTPVDAGGPA